MFWALFFIIVINVLLANLRVMCVGMSYMVNRETSPSSTLVTKKNANRSPLLTMDRSSMAITIHQWQSMMDTIIAISDWQCAFLNGYAFRNCHSNPMLSLASMTPMATDDGNIGFVTCGWLLTVLHSSFWHRCSKGWLDLICSVVGLLHVAEY